MTRHSSFSTLAAVIGVAALATSLAGCSGGGAGAAGPSFPDSVTGVTTITTPAKLSQDVRIAFGRDDAFITPEARKSHWRGVVVAMKNTGDEPVKVPSGVGFGEHKTWGNFDDGHYPYEFAIKHEKQPKGCNWAGGSVNEAHLDKHYPPVTLQPGQTIYGCGLLTAAAFDPTKKLRVVVDTETDYGREVGLPQTVSVPEEFKK